MWFDVPVLAFRSSAIPETLGEAGLMFTEKRPAEVAALAHLLIEDGPLRRTIVEAQRRRRRDFLPDATLSSLLDLLRALGVDHVAEARVVS
jgi:glycosyltransferase involved in cell wall biosynthesis